MQVLLFQQQHTEFHILYQLLATNCSFYITETVEMLMYKSRYVSTTLSFDGSLSIEGCTMIYSGVLVNLQGPQESISKLLIFETNNMIECHGGNYKALSPGPFQEARILGLIVYLGGVKTTTQIHARFVFYSE